MSLRLVPAPPSAEEAALRLLALRAPETPPALLRIAARLIACRAVLPDALLIVADALDEAAFEHALRPEPFGEACGGNVGASLAVLAELLREEAPRRAGKTCTP